MKRYAVACLMSRTENSGTYQSHVTSGTLHIVSGVNANDARGQAVERAFQAKPGFGIDQVLITEIVDGQSDNRGTNEKAS